MKLSPEQKLQNKARRVAALRLFRVADVAVIAVVVFLVAAALFMLFFAGKGQEAEVYVDGKLQATLNLSEDTVLELEHLTVVVKDGKVWVRDADCSDKLCEKCGKVNSSGSSIVCLPAKVVIKISGKAKGVDAIT